MKLICIAMFLALCIASMKATSCKTVVRIKKEAMEYACQTQRQPLQKAFGIIPIPNFSQKVSGGLLGGILNLANNLVGKVLNIVGIKIMEVNLPELNVKFIPKVGVQVSVDTNLHVQANVLLVGEINVKLGAGVFTDVRVSKTSKGFPILAVSACKSILGDLQVTAGGLRVLPFIVNAVQSHIHAILSDRLCVTVSNVFLGMNADLGLMAQITPITDDFGLQYTMPSPPVVTGDYMDMDMNVEYLVHDQVIELPSGTHDFTLPPGAGSKDSMLNMGFSQDFFISMFTAIHSSGSFNMANVGKIPSIARQLTTSALGSYIHAINQRYPQSLPVLMKIVSSQSPIVSFQSNKLIINLTPSVEMLVRTSNSQYQPLFTFNVGLTFVSSLEVKAQKLVPIFALSGDITLTVTSSSMGKCKVSLLTGYIQNLIEKAYLVQINEELSVGVSLPSLPNVQILHPVVDIKENYAVMSCDLQYTK
ncbi:BPI fold-containing family B member 2 [Discoglossus pictus]